MSVLPMEEALFCKTIMDADEKLWKISLYDVLMVFLNWGATLEILGMEEILDSCSERFTPQLPSPAAPEKLSKDIFPSHINVNLVLATIGERVPLGAVMSNRERTLLLRVLVFGALDKQQKSNKFHFYNTLRCVLDSFPTWDLQEAAAVANMLQLYKMSPKNAVFVSTSLLSLSERPSQVGLFACYRILNHQFRLPSEPTLNNFMLHLPPYNELFQRYELWEVYLVTELIQSLLTGHSDTTSPCPKETVEALFLWATELHSFLKTIDMFGEESGFLRERLSRLLQECSMTIRKVYSKSVNITHNDKFLCSPQKY